MAGNFSRPRQNDPGQMYLMMGIGVIFVCVCLIVMAAGGYFAYNRLFNNYEDKIVGTWEDEDGDEVEFRSDGTMVDDYGDISDYEVDGDKVTITDEYDDTYEMYILGLSDDQMEVKYCSTEPVILTKK